MNYIKIQMDALKSISTLRQWATRETEDTTYLMDGNGCELYAIPNKELIINPKVFGDRKFSIKEFTDGAEDVTLTNNAVYYARDNKLILIFENAAGEKIYIDKKHLKHFDIRKSSIFTFKGKIKETFLSIYEGGMYVGTVCGIRMKGENK